MSAWTNADKTPNGEDLPLFRKAFEAGMKGSARAGACRPAWEVTAIHNAIRQLCAEGREFTADDVWELCPGVEVRKDLPGRMVGLMRKGVVVHTGRHTRSNRIDGHGQRLAVWRGAMPPEKPNQ